MGTAKNPAGRNKTIRTTTEEGKRFLDRCMKLTAPVSKEEVVDRTIFGTMEETVPFLPESSVDLLIADPPYNLTKTFHSKTFFKTSEEAYEAYTREWLAMIRPLLAPDASLYVCCDWASSLVIGRVLQEMFCVRNRITWQREKGRGASANWKNGMEDIWFATVGDTYTFHVDAVRQRRRVIAPYRDAGDEGERKPRGWSETKEGRFRDTCPSNFWDDITIPFWSMAENTAHPTQKPEKLLAKLILASSDPGSLVFDPFVGSGSTSVAAKKLGRHYLGIEREAQYCIWTEERLERADADRSIQGYADGVFWERNTAEAQIGKKKE